MSKTDYRPILTGATGGSGSIAGSAPNRIEFRDFVKDKKGFALYVQALDAIYKEPFENDFSWPAIGGIHGDPYVQWGDSGAASFNPSDKEAFGGYCTHGSVLFPTWHRPYIALFEQSMQTAARKIADEYTTDKSEWLTAADNFRVPFWDWALPIAAGEQAVPEEMRSEEVTIITPKGEQKVKNPIYSFTFLSEFPYTTFKAPWNGWQSTLRYPTSDKPDAKSQMDLFNTTIGQNNSQMRAQAYQTLTRLATWNDFSNHTTKQNPPTANSLETIHDTMHLLIGGHEEYLGHMASVPVAGFDALFFMHHANIDRLLALWQAINYDVWVSPGDQPGGTWTIKENDPVTEQSDLTPFWLTQSTYWTSSEVRDYSHSLRYSYPDFDGLEGKTPAQIREAILERVGKLYGPTPLPVQTAGPVRLAKVPSTVLLATGPRATASNTANSTAFDYDSTTHEWTVHIRFKKFELGKSYSIQVYLGETYVGCVSAFTGASAEQCENCRNNQDVELEGFVHLNDVITQKLHTLSPDAVKPWLTTNLHLRLKARKLDGTPADIVHDLPSLKVAPFSRPVLSRDSSHTPPRLGNVTYHHDILAGRAGHTPANRW